VKGTHTIASDWKLASHVRVRLEMLNYSLSYTLLVYVCLILLLGTRFSEWWKLFGFWLPV